MIQYFANRELSLKLQINLAKWKRWSREFLPPDPLGGFQSGYSRQYTADDAFWVFLGGYLVSDMNLSISESKIVLQDLRQWLNQNGFMSCSEQMTADALKTKSLIDEYIIAIMHDRGKNVFYYRIRGMISKTFVEINGIEVAEERYTEHCLLQDWADSDEGFVWNMKNLFITRVLKDFLKKMAIPSHLFQSLS